MTDKPSMTIDEAYERGWIDGLEVAAHFVWECELGGKPYKELPAAIRALKEKEPKK